MHFKWFVLAGLLAFGLSGCNPIELTIGDEVETVDPNPISNVVVFIRDGDIFTTNTKGEDLRQITTSRDARYAITLSYDMQKIAYITDSKTIKIITVDGDLLENLSSAYTNVVAIEWAANNETLFMLRDNSKVIDQYGPSVSLPYYSIPINGTQMESFSVSRNYDVAYCYYDQGFTTNHYETVVVLNDSSNSIYTGSSSYERVAYLHFPLEGGPFVSGYTQYSSSSYSTFKWFYVSGSLYQSLSFSDYDYPRTTIFKNTGEFIENAMYAGANSNPDAINLFYQNGTTSPITFFETNDDPLIFDWKE